MPRSSERQGRRPGTNPALPRYQATATDGVAEVCPVEDLPEGGRAIVEVGSREIGVFNVGGRLYGLVNTCPHQLGPMCEGRVSGTLTASAEGSWRPAWDMEREVVTCPWHGLEFHIPTGQCLAYQRIRVRRFDVFAEDGVVKLRV